MIAAFFTSAVLLIAAWSQTVTGGAGITATWRWEPFSNIYVVTLDGLPPATSSVDSTPAVGGSPAAGTAVTARDIVCAHFPTTQCAFAVRVFMCESRLNPAAVGRAGERGSAQIHPIWFETYGVPPAGLDGQMEQAARIVADVGWRHWSCAQ